MIDDIESQWSRELGADVNIVPASNGEHTLYVDHHYELTAPMQSIEDFLNRLALFTTDDMRDGF